MGNKNLLPIPTTSKENLTRKERISGTTDLGKDYEIKVASLLALRCYFQDLQHFWLATNLHGFDDFADIVIFKQKNESDPGITFFIQINHQEDPQNVTPFLKKYFQCYSDLKRKMCDKGKTTTDLMKHLKQTNSEIVFILFTNGGILGNVEFLQKREEAPPQLDLIRSHGNVYSFASQNLFLLTHQPSIMDIEYELKNIIKKNVHYLKLSERNLTDYVEKIADFIGDYPKGLELTKTNISKKLVEMFLLPFMIRLSNEKEIRKGNLKEDKKENIWNQLVRDKDVTIIDEADDEVKLFCSNSLYNELGEIPLILKVFHNQDVQQIQDILKHFPRVFRLIILNKSNIRFEKFNGIKLFMSLADLSTTHQGLISKRHINLQSKEFASIKKFNINKIESMKLFKVKDIIQILSGRFNIGKELLPKYFVQMSLSRNIFDLVVLKEVKDCFVVKCKKTLANFKNLLIDQLGIRNNEVIEWKELNQNNLHWRIMIFDLKQNMVEDKVVEFCFALGKTIHFLVWHGEHKLHWKKSNKINKNFMRYKDPQNKSVSAEELTYDFLEDKQTLIISANAGMGKSVLLDFFVIKIPTSLWVIKIPLRKYADYYLKWDDLIQSDLVKFLQEVMKTQHDAVLQRFLDSKNLFFLLDGFDEVPVNCQKGAKELIKFINKSGYRMCVTTRPKHRHELELTLHTFATNLNPFNINERTSFLERYFANFSNVSRFDKKVSLFVSKLLEATNLHLSEMDQGFLGTPLEITRFAEVFEDDSTKYLREANFPNRYFDLIYFCEHFINAKIKRRVSEDMVDLYKTSCSFYALQLLFGEDDLQELEIDVINNLLPHPMQKIQQDGILLINDDSKVTFLHHTFAEFLAANWLSQNINTSHKEIVKKLMTKMFQPNFLNVRKMFDLILAKNCPLHTAIITHQVDEVDLDEKAFETTDDGGRTILHLIAAWGLYHPEPPVDLDYTEINHNAMVKVLTKIPYNKLSDVQDNLLNYTPLDYAILSRSLTIADRLSWGIKNLNCGVKISKEESDAMIYYANKYYSIPLYVVIMKFLIRTNQSKNETNNLEKVKSLISNQNVEDSNKEGFLLQTAVKQGLKEITEFLLSIGTNANETEQNGRSALHWASYLGHLEIIILLLSNGAKITATDCYDSTILHYALFSPSINRVDTVSLLLNTFKFPIIKDKYQMSPIHLAACLGQTAELTLLLSQNSDVNDQGWGGLTALILAAQNGHTDSILVLLQFGANINAQDNTHFTALHYAVIKDQEGVAKLLLMNGADLEAKTNSGETPLHLAARTVHRGLVSALLTNSADTNARNIRKETPLHLAVKMGHPDITALILATGSDIEAKDCNKETSLFTAIRKGCSATVTLLLTDGAHIEIRNSDHKCPLHLAAEQGHQDIVTVLLANGADLQAKDCNNETPLLIAVRKGRVHVVTILLANGADIEERNCDEKTALHLAAEEGHQDVVSVLLNKGANIHATTSTKETPLLIAARKGFLDVVTVLLSNGADITARNPDDKTALHLAAEQDHSYIVTLLLDKGADIFALDSNDEIPFFTAVRKGFWNVITQFIIGGMCLENLNVDNETALLVAARYGHLNTVIMLLMYGADINARNVNNETALHLAVYAGAEEVAEELINAFIDIQVRDYKNQTALDVAKLKGYTSIVNIILNDIEE